MDDDDAKEIVHNLRRIKCEEGRGTPDDAVAWLQHEINKFVLCGLIS
jgi:hypothetical protein